MRVTLQPLKIALRRKITMLFALKEKGQSLIESAILVALVVLIIIAVLWLLGFKVGNFYSYSGGSVA